MKKRDWSYKGQAQVSGLTVKRWADPPRTPREADVMTQFIHSYETLGSHVPKGGVVVSTQLQGRRTRPTNASGTSASLGAISRGTHFRRFGDDPGPFTGGER